MILLVVAAFSTVCAVLIDLLQLGDTPLIESIAAMLGSLGAGLFIVDVMLPLCFKLGPERARPYLFAVILIPFVAVFLLLGFGPDLGLSLEFLNQIPETSALGVIALLPLAGLACLGLSFLISCRIVDRKEFLTMRLQGPAPVGGAGDWRHAPPCSPSPASSRRAGRPPGPCWPCPSPSWWRGRCEPVRPWALAQEAASVL